MKTKKLIGWLALFFGIFTMLMNYYIAYFPPESIKSSDSIIVVNMILTVVLFVIALIYLYWAYTEN